MDNYISEGAFIGYLIARLRNAKRGADSKLIAVNYASEAKSFRDECHLIPKLISSVGSDAEEDLSDYEAIQLDYYYWHCILIHYCWKYEYMEGFFHRMAEQVYTYRDEQLRELVS